MARWTAGPDTALIAALVEAQTATEASVAWHYCPFRSSPALLWRNEHPGVRFAAAISLLAAATRLEDHLQDGDPLPLPRFAARRLARRWATQARETAKTLGFDTRPLHEQIAAQRWREAQVNQSLSYYSEPTAFCFGEVFAHTAQLSQRPENLEPLRRVGRAFGQHVYLLDAVEDFVQDQKRGRFNPLLKYGSIEAASQAAEDQLTQAQHDLEYHLQQLTMPRPEWIQPVLGESLRCIGRQRLQCGSRVSACRGGSSKAATSHDKAATVAEQKRIALTWNSTLAGMFTGLFCGGSCGICCISCCVSCRKGSDKSSQGCQGCGEGCGKANAQCGNDCSQGCKQGCQCH